MSNRRWLGTIYGGLIGYGIALNMGLPWWTDWNIMGDRFDWAVVCGLAVRAIIRDQPLRSLDKTVAA